MRKKITTIALLLAFGAVAITGGTLAYFTDTKAATNTFVMGNVKIELTEPNWVNDKENVYPGQNLQKDPTVKNTGENTCYVRIKVQGLEQFSPSYGNITYRTDGIENKLGDEWEKHTDGNFYYKQALEKNDTTDALFDEIVIPTDLVNDVIANDIIITAEAIQADGFEDENGSGSAIDEAFAAFDTQHPVTP